jgi:magnesium transporter
MAEELPLFQSKFYGRVKNINELLLKMIYGATIHFIEHLRAINVVCDSLEDQINLSLENKHLISLFKLEKSLVYYLSASDSNSKLIERLKAHASQLGLQDEESQFMLDDLTIENNQCYRQAEIYSNILASLMDARASIVGNNLNRLMKTLNVITIAIMLPTLVVSLFSMNVEFPGRDHPFMFWLIVALAGFSVGVVRFFWLWKKWGA